jgi:hypothetical protein
MTILAVCKAGFSLAYAPEFRSGYSSHVGVPACLPVLNDRGAHGESRLPFARTSEDLP